MPTAIALLAIWSVGIPALVVVSISLYRGYARWRAGRFSALRSCEAAAATKRPPSRHARGVGLGRTGCVMAAQATCKARRGGRGPRGGVLLRRPQR